MTIKSMLTPVLAVALGAAVAAPALAAADSVAVEASNNEKTITVHVVNHNWLDMRIYVVVGSVSYRLGTVGSEQRRALKLPASITTPGMDLRLVAVPIGAREVNRAPVVIADPGDHVEYRIEQFLQLSTVFRW